MKTFLMLATLTLTLGSDTVADDELSPQPKSRSRAYAYSAVPTVVLTAGGIALMSYASDQDENSMAGWAGFWMLSGGMILGPSLGHVYAERPKPFSGAAIRTGIALLCVGGMALVEDGINEDYTNLAPGMALVWIGSAGWIISALWDIATAERSADQYNERIKSFSLELSPVYLSNHDAPGLAVRFSF